MANKTLVWETNAAATGAAVATYAKFDRVLVQAGFAGRGGQGGGRNSFHADDTYLTHIFVATAVQPGEAVALVRDAYDCLYSSSSKQITTYKYGKGGYTTTVAHTLDDAGQDDAAPAPVSGESCIEYFKRLVSGFADMDPEMRKALMASPLVRHSHISFEFNPLVVNVELAITSGDKRIHTFVARSVLETLKGDQPALTLIQMEQEGPVARIRYGAKLPFILLLIAGGLLADSRAKRGEGLPFSGQGEASSTATPETETSAAGNEKTPGLPQPRVSRNYNQPRKPKAGPSDSSQGNSVRVFFQAHTGSRGTPRLPKEMPHAHEVRPA